MSPRIVVVGIMLLALVSAGCSGASSATPSSASPAPTGTRPVASTTAIGRTAATGTTPPITAAPTTAATTTAAPTTVTTVTSTVTRTRPGQTITVGPPKPTAEPAAVDGACPYLSADLVSDNVTGQHHGQTQLIELRPQPMCVFYRSDGGWMGSVRVIQAASPQAAASAVTQHVPLAGSQPATAPAGWTGGSTTTPGQMTQDSVAKSVYAVSKGDIAVVAEENESPSFKARQMAVCTIYALKLGTGAAPVYCTLAPDAYRG